MIVLRFCASWWKLFSSRNSVNSLIGVSRFCIVLPEVSFFRDLVHGLHGYFLTVEGVN